MSDKITPLLEQLAAKLGTTVEYLWAILVKQAAINGTLVTIGLTVLGVFGFFQIGYLLTRVINGIFNPEYEALRSILRYLE